MVKELVSEQTKEGIATKWDAVASGGSGSSSELPVVYYNNTIMRAVAATPDAALELSLAAEWAPRDASTKAGQARAMALLLQLTDSARHL